MAELKKLVKLMVKDTHAVVEDSVEQGQPV